MITSTLGFTELSLQAHIAQCLDFYFFDDAIFLAECYHAEVQSDLSLNVLATCYYRSGQTMSAYKLFQKHGTRLQESKFLMARCCITLGRLSEAEDLLRQELKSPENPDRSCGNAFPLALLATICSRTSRQQEAAKFYKEALAQNPYLISAIRSLCSLGEDVVEMHVNLVPVSSAGVMSTHFPSDSPFSPQKLSASRITCDISATSSTMKHSINFATPGFSQQSSSSLDQVVGGPSIVLQSAATTLGPPNPASKLTTPDTFGNATGVIGSSSFFGAPKKANSNRNDLARRSELCQNTSTNVDESPHVHMVGGVGVRPLQSSRGQDSTDTLPRRSTRLLRSSKENNQGSKNALEEVENNRKQAQQQRSGELISQLGRHRTMRPGFPSRRTGSGTGNVRRLTGSQQQSLMARKSQRVAELNRINVESDKNVEIGSKDTEVAVQKTGTDSSSTDGARVQMVDRSVQFDPTQTMSQAELWCFGERVGKPMDSFPAVFFKSVTLEQYLARYQNDRALSIIGSMSQAMQKTGYVQCARATCFFEKSEYLKAVETFKTVRLTAPHYLRDMDTYSTALWHLGHEVELSSLAQQLTTDFPQSPEAWCAAGNCFSYQKEHETAIKMFERAIQVCPTFAPAYALLGAEYTEIWELEKAQQCYRSAIRLQPRSYKAWFGIGNVYCKMGKLLIAEYYYKKAQTINSRNPVLVCHVSVVSINLNMKHFSTELVKKQHINDILLARHYSDLQMLQRQQKHADAHKMLARAVEDSPTVVLCRYHLAECLMAMERYEDALEELDQLKQLVPRESRVYLLAGKVYKKLKKHHLALMNFSWATDLDPRGGVKHAHAAGDQIEDEPITALATMDADESQQPTVMESDDAL